MRLHDLLQAERERRGWTIDAAAVLAGVGHSVWSRWESGLYEPTVRTIQTCARVLGVRLSLETDGYGYDIHVAQYDTDVTVGAAEKTPTKPQRKRRKS